MGRAMLFVQRELAGSLRARWFLAYSAVFLAGGVLLATFGMGDAVIYGFRGFAKAFTGLVHLALLFVPLMALFPAAAAIAEDRESGALEYVLAQPVTFGEVYAGKLGGVSLAVLLSMTLGFGAAGAVFSWRWDCASPP
jgi:ABC-2 type transport system permease protein